MCLHDREFAIFAIFYGFTKKPRKWVPQNISFNEVSRMAESVSLHIKDFYKWKPKKENLQAFTFISYFEFGESFRVVLIVFSLLSCKKILLSINFSRKCSQILNIQWCLIRKYYGECFPDRITCFPNHYFQKKQTRKNPLLL